MTISILFALLGFAFVATVTPGPNNLMLMTAGANFGFRRAIPHMTGIVIGVTVLTFLVGAGLMALFDAYPALGAVLKIASTAYLLWLAMKIATAKPAASNEKSSEPMTLIEAAAFQWVNPKTWAMALSAITLYAPSQSFSSVAVIAAVFAAVCFPAISVWTWLGTLMNKWLSSPLKLRAFNMTMALLLIGSLYPILAMEI